MTQCNTNGEQIRANKSRYLPTDLDARDHTVQAAVLDSCAVFASSRNFS